eukprot:jgi/Psemu1/301248/fgenesh1_kg.28_\
MTIKQSTSTNDDASPGLCSSRNVFRVVMVGLLVYMAVLQTAADDKSRLRTAQGQLINGVVTVKEKVTWPEDCFWSCYLQNNPDLTAALAGQTDEYAFEHYIAFGQYEGRDCYCRTTKEDE